VSGSLGLGSGRSCTARTLRLEQTLVRLPALPKPGGWLAARPSTRTPCAAASRHLFGFGFARAWARSPALPQPGNPKDPPVPAGGGARRLKPDGLQQRRRRSGESAHPASVQETWKAEPAAARPADAGLNLRQVEDFTSRRLLPDLTTPSSAGAALAPWPTTPWINVSSPEPNGPARLQNPLSCAGWSKRLRRLPACSRRCW